MSLVLKNLRLPLAHFTLEIDATLSSRVTAIFGPSGSGKTSLLELIAGLRRPASGSIELSGTVLTDRATHQFIAPQHRAIGYVPQDGALFPHLSVRKNLLYGFSTTHERPAGLSLDHIVEVLEISPLLDRSIATLSGGEKQRVALGRALLAAPKLLLLDEPLASLDVALKERLIPYLLRIRDEFTIPMIYVTHSPDEVVALCDDALILLSGKIEKRGRPADLFEVSETPRYRLREQKGRAE
ncbi:molybdenum ABC transporter ATP-binding protein [Nibricoccus aquaticus]|uniref:Molybdenum ABC transporter ATP-binding protein n=1 Tax=Nibricoccus aquaticus TaxID=2576891 RepID=A0A290QLR5_9BACT|nr:ATP-binding cassette domain-containing protein [Nibricoccus aquaticus]ATC64992.1 molybdenum ABC transporter ATP-binding protein [Nibricoccus aquaticus]